MRLLDYESAKTLIKSAILNCNELKNSHIIDAFPSQNADSPVKKNICAIGLLSIKNEHSTLDNTNGENIQAITVFVDIYTPILKGGDYSSSCAIDLCSQIDTNSEKYKVSSIIDGVVFVGTCRAFKSRIKVVFTKKTYKSTSEGDSSNAFYISIDSSPFACRKIQLKNQSALNPIECYGESYPTDFICDEKCVTLTVNRYPGDDGKVLGNVNQPFNIDFSNNYHPALSKCVITKYEFDEALEREILTIVGRCSS